MKFIQSVGLIMMILSISYTFTEMMPSVNDGIELLVAIIVFLIGWAILLTSEDE